MSEIARMDESAASAVSKVGALSNPSLSVFSTITQDSFEGKVATLNAMNNAARMEDHLNEVIHLKDVVVQAVALTNSDPKTGEVTEDEALRVILIAADGSSYAALSSGMVRSLQDMFAIVGMPDTWPSPLPVKVTKERSRSGFNFFTISIVAVASEKPAK